MSIWFDAFLQFFTMGAFLYVAGGILFGLFIGAVPGLGPVTALALAIPVTFGMEPVVAMSFLVSVYTGAVSGGGISATLLNIPGTSGSIATCFDGFPLSKQGRGREALAICLSASALGAMLGTLSFATIGPVLGRASTALGPAEYTALIVMAFILVAAGSRSSMVKGLIMAVAGLMIAFVGRDVTTATPRYTGGSLLLSEGIPFVSAVIGLYAMSQVFAFAREGRGVSRTGEVAGKILPGIIYPLRRPFIIARSSVIGVGVGLLPGVGIALSGLLNWVVQKNTSKDPESYGKGNRDGLVAAELGNNATSLGSLSLAFSLGVPGGSADAVLLGGLLLYGLNPGPSFYDTSGGSLFFPVLVIGMLLGPLVVVASSGGVRFLSKLTAVPHYRLIPMITLLAVIGSYAERRQLIDVWIMFAFGILGYILYRADYPVHNMVIAIVLGELFEANLNRVLRLSGGSMDIFWERPIARAILFVCVFGLIWGFVDFKKIGARLQRRSSTNQDESAGTSAGH
jgi:putative tricarboxylic transport membrane protein